MRHLAVGVLIGLLVGATGVTAQGDPEKIAPERTPSQTARSAARDWIAPLVRPDLKPVQISVLRCRDLGRWTGCRVRIIGATRCNAVLRVRGIGDSDYGAWMPRARCR